MPMLLRSNKASCIKVRRLLVMRTETMMVLLCLGHLWYKGSTSKTYPVILLSTTQYKNTESSVPYTTVQLWALLHSTLLFLTHLETTTNEYTSLCYTASMSRCLSMTTRQVRMMENPGMKSKFINCRRLINPAKEIDMSPHALPNVSTKVARSPELKVPHANAVGMTLERVEPITPSKA